MARERWGSKLGIIMAVAGSAIGLGNFLRFPGKAAANGGGAFMIPYFIAFLLLGLPLMWVEWTIGRRGGGFGHSTAPGAFHTLWNKNRFIKYFGVIGIFGPILIFVYYTYVESWLLGYSMYSLFGHFEGMKTPESMKQFLTSYKTYMGSGSASGIVPAYGFFLATFVLNILVVGLGVRGGIEVVCKYGLPLLLGLAVILVIRVFTMGSPLPEHPEYNVVNGLGFLWNPDWSALGRPRVWLEAAGQVFFTLSLGTGVILTYASYLSKADDIALSGLTAAGANEFAEVILGGSIVIPAAFAFFGPALVGMGTDMFSLGFITMPLVLQQMPAGNIMGFLWFFLLFMAGVTSSISLCQPAVAFLQDEFSLSRKQAVVILGMVAFVLMQGVIFGPGVLDEMDFWGGTFCLVLFGTIEVILFAWVFGIDKAWDEMHRGSELRIPVIYHYILKYATPVLLLVILGTWLAWEGIPTIKMTALRAQQPQVVPYAIATRVAILVLFVVLVVMVKIAWRRRKNRELANEA